MKRERTRFNTQPGPLQSAFPWPDTQQSSAWGVQRDSRRQETASRSTAPQPQGTKDTGLRKRERKKKKTKKTPHTQKKKQTKMAEGAWPWSSVPASRLQRAPARCPPSRRAGRSGPSASGAAPQDRPQQRPPRGGAARPTATPGRQLPGPGMSPPRPEASPFTPTPGKQRAGLAGAEIGTEIALTMELPLLAALRQGCAKPGRSLRGRHGVIAGHRAAGTALPRPAGPAPPASPAASRAINAGPRGK